MKIFGWLTFVALIILSFYAASNLFGDTSFENSAQLSSLLFPAVGVLGYVLEKRFVFRSFWLLVLILSFAWAAYSILGKWAPHLGKLEPDIVVGVTVGVALYNAAYIASFIILIVYWRNFTKIPPR